MFTDNDNLVLDFFLGLAKIQTWSLCDILSFTEKDIEEYHDFIQLIFPTIEPSQYNRDAPQISEEFKKLFLNNSIAQENFCKSCRMFLNFIGFKCVLGEISVLTGENVKMFYDRPSHNLLRITRVLNSLNQIGKRVCSRNLFSKLESIYSGNLNKITEDTFKHWKDTQRLKKLVVLTGSGISVEPGIPTFRGEDGIWNGHRIQDVCTAKALINNRPQVIEFYNDLRKKVLEKTANDAHLNLKKLEEYCDVQIITQNVDDFHERAGSKNVLHLHGEIRKLCSSLDFSQTLPIDGWKQELDTKHPADESLLRPFIVFFHEQVPMFEHAIQFAAEADIFVVIGTSLQVYPAADLLMYIRANIPIYVIDITRPLIRCPKGNRVHFIEQPATKGTAELLEIVSNLV